MVLKIGCCGGDGSFYRSFHGAGGYTCSVLASAHIIFGDYICGGVVVGVLSDKCPTHKTLTISG